ncbi:YceD family protein [Halodurantibacterium flavum]|uniref:YceD family protein n=1 Tax=Halodurantibacterium flavum TaxID=1382802 RepID=A0ABW4SC63_9RHOB
MTDQVTDQPYSHPLRVADLPGRKPSRFEIVPDDGQLQAIAAAIGASNLRKVRMKGELRPLGRTDWELEAELGATVVQPCIVTLAPVTTRIDEPLSRRWLRDMPEPAGDEAEMPADDGAEPLGPVIDLGIVLTEALALALPLYPRAPGAELGEAGFAPPGAEPLSEDKIRPFAALAALRDKLGTAPAQGDGAEEAPGSEADGGVDGKAAAKPGGGLSKDD